MLPLWNRITVNMPIWSISLKTAVPGISNGNTATGSHMQEAAAFASSYVLPISSATSVAAEADYAAAVFRIINIAFVRYSLYDRSIHNMKG